MNQYTAAGICPSFIESVKEQTLSFPANLHPHLPPALHSRSPHKPKIYTLTAAQTSKAGAEVVMGHGSDALFTIYLDFLNIFSSKLYKIRVWLF